MKYSLIALLCIGLLVNACSEDETTTAGPQIDVKAASSTCSTALCAGAAATTFPGIIAWSSQTCAAILASISTVQVSVISVNNATCDGGTSCTLSSGTYLNEETEAPTTTMPEADTTALAWYDLNNNSDTVSDPDTGDTVCCLEGQTGAATLTNTDCTDL